MRDLPTAAGLLATASAISVWENPNTSCRTKTARSSGLKVSRITSMAIDTERLVGLNRLSWVDCLWRTQVWQLSEFVAAGRGVGLACGVSGHLVRSAA
jgi:hypothetical protein